ncbi:cupin domain protein [Cladophialophora carrionii]|uniref:Cupin domain protein n=1 Tax=Cladophialophora carrionii TaxID=86049 RepID=A0A1C1CKV3_9EURO|nr:cupin domain protein [Cladophialophora carrionii]
MALDPEIHHLQPNAYAPNSDLPVLIYRDVLPLPVNESTATTFLEGHGWERRGVWGHIAVRHFHPNSHECYGIFQGQSTLLLGCGSSDPSTASGLHVDVHVGDVVILPAGTAHCSVESTPDYRYVGVYPKGCPRWRNELGKEPIDEKALRKEILAVALPTQDPVTGPDGALMRLWGRERPHRSHD